MYSWTKVRRVSQVGRFSYLHSKPAHSEKWLARSKAAGAGVAYS